MSNVVYKAICWDCQDIYIGKTKRWLHDRKNEHFKAITSNCHASAIADHVTSTGHIFDTNLWFFFLNSNCNKNSLFNARGLKLGNFANFDTLFSFLPFILCHDRFLWLTRSRDRLMQRVYSNVTNRLFAWHGHVTLSIIKTDRGTKWMAKMKRPCQN